MAPGDDHFITEGAEIDILRWDGGFEVSCQFKVKADVGAVHEGLMDLYGNHIGSRQQGFGGKRGGVDSILGRSFTERVKGC